MAANKKRAAIASRSKERAVRRIGRLAVGWVIVLMGGSVASTLPNLPPANKPHQLRSPLVWLRFRDSIDTRLRCSTRRLVGRDYSGRETLGTVRSNYQSLNKRHLEHAQRQTPIQ